MGTAWSRWLQRDDAFDKTRHVDAKAQRLFYESLKLAATAIEQSLQEENADTLDADATVEGDEAALAQLQYVLENWAREAGVLYDRVGDFPLILPLTRELHAAAMEGDAPTSVLSPLPTSRDELQLKATSSDKMATSELLYEAMYSLANKLPQDEFLRLVAKYPRASRLFVAQAVQAQTNAEAPFRLWTCTGQYSKAAAHVGKLAYGEESFVKKMGRLQEMALLLQRVELDPNTPARERANASFQRVMTEEMIELIDTQNRLENLLGVMHLVGSSVVETIHKLLTLFPAVPTALSTAVTVGEDFRIHPRQFWWCLIKIFGASDQWRTLFMLSAAVPPPCGYLAIAEALVEAQRTELSTDLLACISSTTERDSVVRFFGSLAPSPGVPAEEYGYAEDEDPPVMV